MLKTERINNSRKNVSANIVIYTLQAVLSFAVRTIFIRKLGAELLGLDSLLINILSMLSIAELGFSTAVSYGLYKPLASRRIDKISAYMSFYKRVYKFIGIIIIVIGIILSFFLKKIIGDYNYQYLYLVYFIYLFNTAIQYFISYKEVLIAADQKNYKLFKYTCTFPALMYILQFIILFFTENYILYLLIMLVSRLVERVFINRYITKYYKDINFNSKESLSKRELDVIKENITGLFFLKIGNYVITSTDNIIISSVIGIVTVGVYTNYVSITSILKTIITKIFNGVTASIGNLSTNKNKESEREVFEIMTFVGFIIYGYVTTCLLNMINFFVEVWLGADYVVSLLSMIIICINFYLMCNQLPLDTYKEAYGFYTKDRYVPIIQAIINIVFSIILGIKIGLNGVLLGTTISYIMTIFWNKPYMLYKYIFKDSSKRYFINQIFYLFTMILIYIITFNLFNYLNLSVNFLNLILIGIITTIIYAITVIILYSRKKEFKLCLKMIGK